MRPTSKLKAANHCHMLMNGYTCLHDNDPAYHPSTPAHIRLDAARTMPDMPMLAGSMQASPQDTGWEGGNTDPTSHGRDGPALANPPFGCSNKVFSAPSRGVHRAAPYI